MDYISYIRGFTGHSEIFLMCAGAVIADDKGRVLLQKRGDTGKWGLPGGCMELGESAEETAVRETFEETGLVVEVGELIGIYTKYKFEYPNGDKAQTVLAAFTAKIKGGALKCDGGETLDLRFFAEDELPEMSFVQQQDILEDYFSGKRGCFR